VEKIEIWAFGIFPESNGASKEKGRKNVFLEREEKRS
jgi:hypothetical protein